MSANIEELVRKHSRAFSGDVRGLRNALTEQAETHAMELRAYEATVENLEQRIRELEATVAEYDRRIVAVGCVAINSVSREHHEAEVSRLNDLYEKAVAGRQAFRERVRELEAQKVPEGWIAVSDNLPEPGELVLAYYKNSVGGDRIICGFHAPKHTLEADYHDDESCFDFDESTNTDYMAEGWLERLDNWGEYRSIYVVEGKVTHWMPLPAAPAQEKK